MKIEIYGREGCPYCSKAKALVVDLKTKTNLSIDYIYHDMNQESLTKDDLTYIMGFGVSTVPQILINDRPIKGGYSGFNEYIGNEVAKGNITFK